MFKYVHVQEKLAHHRWLISFTFRDRSSTTNEYKKLQAFLRNDHIQVPSVRLSHSTFLAVFLLTDCFSVSRSAEWTVSPTQSCVILSTSTNPVWLFSKVWGSTTLRSTMVSTGSSLSCICLRFTCRIFLFLQN